MEASSLAMAAPDCANWFAGSHAPAGDGGHNWFDTDQVPFIGFDGDDASIDHST